MHNHFPVVFGAIKRILTDCIIIITRDLCFFFVVSTKLHPAFILQKYCILYKQSSHQHNLIKLTAMTVVAVTTTKRSSPSSPLHSQLFQASSQSMRIKRQKLNHRNTSLLSLPNEVLLLIFALVSKQDIISVSMASKLHRDAMLPFVLNRLYVSWDNLEKFITQFDLQLTIKTERACSEDNEHQIHCKTLCRMVKELIIYKSNNRLEWQSVKELNLLISSLPHLDHIKINLSSASFCLRYYKFKESIKTLHIKTDKQDAVFSLEHLHQFQNIGTLVLENFSFASFNNSGPKSDTNKYSQFVTINTGHEAMDNENNPSIPIITNLKLINCSWLYPFHLDEFIKHNSCHQCLQSIVIVYNNNNNFLLSERLKFFLAHPIIAPSLKSLVFDVMGSSRLVKFANIESYMNIEQLRKLQQVFLYGVPMHNCDIISQLLESNNTVRALGLSFVDECFHDEAEKTKIVRQVKEYLEQFQNQRGEVFKFSVRLNKEQPM